jgi:hypothetical protein
VTRTQHAGAVLAAALILSAAAGCTLGPADPSPTPTSSSVTLTPKPATPIPTVTPSTPATPQPAEAEVVALVKKYYEIDELITNNPKAPLRRYKEVSTGSNLNGLQDYRRGSRNRGERYTGKTKIIGEPRVKTLQPADNPARAKAIACLDVRGTRAVDRQGKSIVRPGRPDFYIDRLSLKLTEAGWRVHMVRSRGVSKC